MIPKISIKEMEFVRLNGEWVMTAHVDILPESGWDSVYLGELEDDPEPLTFFVPDEEIEDE